MSVYDELLVDAVDVHCHVDFELGYDHLRKIQPEWQWLPQAEAMGMRGVVLKSHWWPTGQDVYYLRQLYDGDVQLVPSITLNGVAGCPRLWVVESAVAMGCQVVYLPTWSSANDLAGGGMSARLAKVIHTLQPTRIPGLQFQHEGRLSAEGKELLHYCKNQGLTLATGHISWNETMLFVEEARRIRYDRLLFTHPLSHGVSAPLEAVRAAANQGCWVEMPWTNMAPGRRSGAQLVEWARSVGLERIVASTDYFRGSCPPPPMLFRFYLGELYNGGLSLDEIRQIAATNPARALGWD